MGNIRGSANFFDNEHANIKDSIMKKALIITRGLLIPMYLFSWSRIIVLTKATSLTEIFAIIYYVKFFIIILLLNNQFFTKPHKKTVIVILVAMTELVTGTICWIDTSFLIENQKMGHLALWQTMPWYQFIYSNAIASGIGILHILAGICGALLTDKLLNKFIPT